MRRYVVAEEILNHRRVDIYITDLKKAGLLQQQQQQTTPSTSSSSLSKAGTGSSPLRRSTTGFGSGGKKAVAVENLLWCSLEELYEGSKRTMVISRIVPDDSGILKTRKRSSVMRS
ncbi:hypothetical protein Vadar_010676 [Vaccinium darrowii]|uniref:Uncharacterized protein n=1 Tax=Vaccinium darrowii TaxID=229202 RepID=A0ACB7ZJH5_9ERIC|nr:hypothetical protein Vadar_010676 [Vaccinium darrowii]